MGVGSGSPRPTSSSLYHNIYDTFKIDSSWSSELQLAARYAWVSRLGPSAGEAYWEHFVSQFMAWRAFGSLAEVREPGDVMFLLLTACVRWPAVLFQAFDALDGFEPRAGCVA